MALTGTPDLNLQNEEECRQSLNVRYGANAEAIVRDAQAAVRRLGQDVVAYLNHTRAGNDPGTLFALAEFHRGTTRLSKAGAHKELAKIRASKEFQRGDRYTVDRGRLISAIAYQGDKSEVKAPREGRPVGQDDGSEQGRGSHQGAALAPGLLRPKPRLA